MNDGPMGPSPTPPDGSAPPPAGPETGPRAYETGAASVPPGPQTTGQGSPGPYGFGIAQPPAGPPTTATAAIGPATRSRRRFAGVLAVVGAIIAVLAVKVAIGALVSGVATTALGAFFGGPAARLPSDVQANLEKRINTAVGTSLDGLSDTDKQARILTLIKAGLPRLDAATLLHRVQLEAAAVRAVDVATCATFARTGTTGTTDADAAAKVIAALDTTSYGAWIEINVEAVEAQTAGAPAVRTISATDSDAMFKAVFAKMSATDIATLSALSAGTEETDPAACASIRALYAAGIALQSPLVDSFALADASSAQ